MIVHIAYSGVGGTGSFVGDLCPRLGQHSGQESRVIFYGVEPLHLEYGQRLRNAGIEFSVVRKTPGIDLSSVCSVARELRRLRPDIVVMHGGGTAWNWPLLRALGVRARLVLVEHGPEISWGYLRHLISLACADQVIAISASLGASLREKFGFLLRSKQLFTIPNGVDTDFFQPGDSPQCRDLILNVATLSPVKDQATLIRACALISEHQEIRLRLAGDGVTRSHLEELSRECGMEKRITFLGNVGRDRLVDLYRQAAVFVLSTRGEGLSLAMLEAMACGLPIVASDVPGVTEILAGTGCAFLVPQGVPSEMARAIKNVLDNPQLAAQMGKLARQCVTRLYSTDRMAAQYREILNAI